MPSRQKTFSQALAGQRFRQLFHGNGLMLFVPAQQYWRASSPFPPLRGQRSFSRSPDGRGFLNTDDILQTQFGEPFSKLAIVAIGGIGQHGSRYDFFLDRFPNLLKRDRRLGGKGNLSRNASLFAALPILRPNLWQVQTPRDRKTGLFGSQRQTNCDPTIFLLAHLSTVLTHDPNGVSSFLGKTRVVHDPSHDRTVSLHHRQHRVAHPFEQGRITPRCVGYEMMERLMHAPHIMGSQSRGQGLNTLAFTGK